MPRQPRLQLTGYPFHCIARGNDRQAVFYNDDDFSFYLSCLHDGARKYEVAVHAYVLMTNHVHLLATPHQPFGLSRLFQSIGRLYVRYINKTYRRSGTLWEGRFKASLVDAGTYLLACYRYIELNPVRAGIIERAEEYRWSSAKGNLALKEDRHMTPHEGYLTLGRSQEERAQSYRALLESGIPVSELRDIRKAAGEGRVLGNDRFREQIEVMLNRRLSPEKRGPKRRTK